MSFWKLEVISVYIFCTIQVVLSKEKTLQRDTNNRYRYAHFQDNLYHALDGKRVETGYAETKEHCLLKCVKNLECFSTNIGVNSGADSKVLCELLSSDKYSSSGSFQQSSVFHHYSIQSPCESLPCQHGGTCQALYETSDYSCNCIEDYTGINCEEFLPCGVDQDWKLFGSSCYKYFSQKLSWSDASSHCKGMNGTQGIFHTSEEYAFVITAVLPANRYDIWIGLSDHGQGGSRDWKWLDGSGLTFSRWYSPTGEPNNLQEKCAGAYLGNFHGWQWNHDWHDYHCTSHFAFICERRAKFETEP